LMAPGLITLMKRHSTWPSLRLSPNDSPADNQICTRLHSQSPITREPTSSHPHVPSL
jgi:hypothetical protein